MKSPSIVPSQSPDAGVYELKDCGDLYDFKGAGVLAKHIERFWKARGYKGIVVERFEIPGTRKSFGVRSNMVNGFPPKQAVLAMVR
jgi:hypothetical protein